MQAPQSVLRIIDANLNRAREALRVTEEYVRFDLEDRSLTEEFKKLRHSLASALPADIDHLLLSARHTQGDVGTTIATDFEHMRHGTSHVALAATKRLSEALRALEEYGKTFNEGFAAKVEAMRYQGYELEQRIALVEKARTRFRHIRLYVLLTESLCSTSWLATAKAVLAGGADCIQLREKNLGDRELLERTRILSELCHENDTLCIVNDRPDIAILGHADGVHIGQDDMNVWDTRRVLTATAIIGVSTHSSKQAQSACEDSPDYVAVGPMFASSTKTQSQTAGPNILRAVADSTSLPIVAIGGIDETNIEKVLGAARCGICICSAIISQQDALVATQRIRAMIDDFPGDTT